MSLTKKDRKIQSGFGITFPTASFAEAIAPAFRHEYGSSTGAIKTVVGLVGGNERAVKNWFDAKNAPNGESVVALCRHSDEVLTTVLRMAGRTAHVRARLVVDLSEKFGEVLAILDEIKQADADLADD